MEPRPNLIRRLLEARSERRDISRFRALLAAPTTSNPFVLPGRARLAISSSQSEAAGNITVALAGHESFSHPALAANQVWRGYSGERTYTITLTRNAGAAATVKVYLVDIFGRHKQIASITV